MQRPRLRTGPFLVSNPLSRALVLGWMQETSGFALILPQIGLSLPLAILWLRTAFASTAPSLAETAGAGRIRT